MLLYWKEVNFAEVKIVIVGVQYGVPVAVNFVRKEYN